MNDDPATCMHERIDTVTTDKRDWHGRLVRVDVDVRCSDCGASLQTEHYFHHHRKNPTP